MTTIQDVARAAGVAASTVSRYLNGQLRVTPATEAKVLEAVSELGYVPNAQARNLARRRSGVIGFVVPEISNPYFGAIADYVVEAVERHGRHGPAVLAPQPGRAGVQLHRAAVVRGHRRHDVPGLVPVERAAGQGDRRRARRGRGGRADRRAAAGAHRGHGRLRGRVPGHQLPGGARAPQDRVRVRARRARLGAGAIPRLPGRAWPRRGSTRPGRSASPGSSPSSSG